MPLDNPHNGPVSVGTSCIKSDNLWQLCSITHYSDNELLFFRLSTLQTFGHPVCPRIK